MELGKLRTLARIAPLLGVLTVGSGCQPREDLTTLSCDQLRARITDVSNAPNNGWKFEGRAMVEDARWRTLKKLDRALQSKDCE